MLFRSHPTIYAQKSYFFIPPYSIQYHGDNQRILCLNNFKKTFSLKDPLVQSLLRISVTLLLKTTGADKRKARPSWTMITVFWRRSGQAGWPAAGLYVWACSSCWPPPEIILFKVFEKRRVDQPLVFYVSGHTHVWGLSPWEQSQNVRGDAGFKILTRINDKCSQKYTLIIVTPDCISQLRW